MSKERLDEILLRLGLVEEKQIKRALLRQKTHGGLLGSHLLYYKFLTEKQLLTALSEQFGVEGIELIGRKIPADTVAKLPLKVVEKYRVLPVGYNEEERLFSIAMLDPENEEAIAAVSRASGGFSIKPYVAAENALQTLIDRYYYGREVSRPVEEIIELPDLFEGEEIGSASAESEPAEPPRAPQPETQVLMVTRDAFLKNFLVSIFEREGKHLRILADPEEISSLLREHTINHLLISDTMEPEFHQWVKDGLMPAISTEISVYGSVSSALLNNPVSYDQVVESLIRALEQMQEDRSAQQKGTPPYERVREDLTDLGNAIGIPRLTADGMRIGSCLLRPSPAPPISGSGPAETLRIDHFVELDRSLRVAKSLLFPWDVEGCLRIVFLLISGKHSLDEVEKKSPELVLPAQLLILVWYRYCVLGDQSTSVSEEHDTIKASLRQLAGRQCSTSYIETYLQLLGQKERQRLSSSRDVFIAADENEIVTQVSTLLRRSGHRVVLLGDVTDAWKLLKRRRADAVILDYDSQQDRAVQFCKAVNVEPRMLVYAFTQESNPSVAMHLLESGFDDVFLPPHNPEIILARISSALASQHGRKKHSRVQNGFRGTFRELPFLDLVQTLSISGRSVRVVVDHNGGGAQASLYLKEGQLHCAECKDLNGVEAVYEVIRWGEKGSFSLTRVNEFPSANISDPTEYVLIEGCRRLDEESEE